MPIDLSKVAQDILNQDPELRILALQTLLRLDGADLVNRPDLMSRIRTDLTTLASQEDGGDSRFFARQCLDHLSRASRAAQPPPPAIPPRPAAPATPPAPPPAAAAPPRPSPPRDPGTPDIDVFKRDDPPAHLAVLARIAELAYQAARPAVLDLLKREPRTEVVASILSALMRIGRPEDLRVVAPLLRAKDGRVRANAVELVEYLAPKQIVPLLSPMCDDPVDRVRANALKALGAIGEDAVFASLGNMLASQSIGSRVASLYALKHIRSDRALDLLAQAARDPSEEVRVRVVAALKAHKGHPRAAEILKTLSNDIDISICEAAFQALTFICVDGAAGATEENAPKAGGPVEALSQQDQQVQLRSLREIESRCMVESRPTIVALMRTSQDPLVLAQAIATLSSFQLAEDSELVAKFLAHPNDRLRANAVEAIVRMVPPEAARQALQTAVNDPDSRVRANAICCLFRLGAPGLEPRVREMVTMPDSSMRVSGLWAASQMGILIAPETLHGLLADSNEDIRQRIVESLNQYPPTPELADLVRALMKDPVVAIHEAAAKIWETIHDAVDECADGEATNPSGSISGTLRRTTRRTETYESGESGGSPPGTSGAHSRTPGSMTGAGSLGRTTGNQPAYRNSSENRLKRPPPLEPGSTAPAGTEEVADPFSRKSLFAALESGRKTGERAAPVPPEGASAGRVGTPQSRPSYSPRGSLSRTAQLVISELEAHSSGSKSRTGGVGGVQSDLESLYVRLDQELEQIGRKIYQMQTEQVVSEPAFSKMNYQIKRFDDLLKKRQGAANSTFLSKLPFFRSARKDAAAQQLEFNLAEEYRKLGEAVIELRHSLDRVFPGVEQHYESVENLLVKVKQLKEKGHTNGGR